MASSVSRLSVKPNTCIRKMAPMSDIGMATSGTSTERSEPRNRKITIATISSVSLRVLHHLVDGVLDVLGGVVGDARLQPGGQLLSGSPSISARTRLITSSELALGSGQIAHEHRRLAREPHLRVVVLGAEHHVGHVAQPHERAVPLAHDQVAELRHRAQVGVGGEVHLHQRALGLADGGEEVVGGQRLAHLGRVDVQRRHAVGLEPDAHGEGACRPGCPPAARPPSADSRGCTTRTR